MDLRTDSNDDAGVRSYGDKHARDLVPRLAMGQWRDYFLPLHYYRWFIVFAVATALIPIEVNAEVINFAGTGTGTTDIVASGGVQKVGQFFTTSVDAEGAIPTVCVFKQGSPTDDLIISIQTDSAGEPSGTSIGSISITGSGLPTTCAGGLTEYDEIVATIDELTDYWLVFARSSSLSDTDKYGISIDDTGGLFRYYGGAWHDDGQNAEGQLETNEGGGDPPVLNVTTDIFPMLFTGLLILIGTMLVFLLIIGILGRLLFPHISGFLSVVKRLGSCIYCTKKQ